VARILVVDDERSVRLTFSQILKNHGHDVWMAEGAPEALQTLSQHEIDVMVSDICMPGLNGLDLMSLVSSEAPDVVVVLVTGEPTAETAIQALRGGALDYLCKPVSPEELIKAVEEGVHAKQYRDRNHHFADHREVQDKAVELVFGRCEHGNGQKGGCIHCTLAVLRRVAEAYKEVGIPVQGRENGEQPYAPEFN
jgi:DNA-binding NtrC family response regulator